MKNFFRNNWFKIGILFLIPVAVILNAYLLSIFTGSRTAVQENCPICEKDAQQNKKADDSPLGTLEDVIGYSDYSTVNWEQLSETYHRPYNCDWKSNESYNGVDIDKLIDKNNNYNEITPALCEIYDNLQNAKTDFKKRATVLRITSSTKVGKALNETEYGFDETFLKIAGDYYSRAFIDYYNEIMKPKFDNLEKAIKTQYDQNIYTK